MTLARYTNPKNGDTIETKLTQDEAAEICKRSGDNFAQDIAFKYERREYLGITFSEAQLYWLMRKATEIIKPADARCLQLAEGAYEKLRTLLTSPELKSPRLRFKTAEGTFTIYIAHSGNMWVTCGRTLLGKIRDNDMYYPRGKDLSRQHTELLKLVAENPRDAAIIWGQKYGMCCFCFRELSTPESVTAGYGPICAERWGLPWGDTGGEEYGSGLLALSVHGPASEGEILGVHYETIEQALLELEKRFFLTPLSWTLVDNTYTIKLGNPAYTTATLQPVSEAVNE